MSEPTVPSSLPGPPALDDGVDRPHALDLDHAGALARPVGRVELLGDDALGALQPLLRAAGLEHDRREVDRGADPLLEPRAALVLGQLEQALVALGQQVEGDEARRRLLGEHADPRLGGVDALAERVEVLPSLLVEQHDLAVEHVAAVRELELGEVARERAPVARLQVHVAAVHERDRAEAVPLRLVAPAVPAGKRLRGAGELGQQRRCERERHAPRKSESPPERALESSS